MILLKIIHIRAIQIWLISEYRLYMYIAYLLLEINKMYLYCCCYLKRRAIRNQTLGNDCVNIL